MQGNGRLSTILWLLAASANVGLFIFLLHASGTPNIFRRTKQILLPQNDPPLKSLLPTSLRPFLDGQKPLLVVAFGKCSECTLNRLSGWVVMLERWSDQVKGVIVAAEKEQTLRRLWEERGWKVAFVADEREEILRALNPWFLPRAYGFNLKGELVWRQENPEGSELQAIRSLVEAVKGKGYARKIFDRPPAWMEALKKAKAGERR